MRHREHFVGWTLWVVAAVACDAGSVGTFPPEDPRLSAENRDAGDEYGGRFPFEAAVAGLDVEGPLWTTLETELGNIRCDLDASGAPLTVANFVGLARGIRPFASAAHGAYVREPFYDGTVFHRALPGQLVQGGRRDGEPRPGFRIQDEFRVGEAFDRPGVLAMANDGDPATGGAQFFITTSALRELDGKHTIFGHCDQPLVVRALERAVLDGETPALHHVEIGRGPRPD